MHIAWFKPIVILLFAVVLQRVNALSLGYVLFRITHDIERLPFPMAAVQAGGATALAESSTKNEGWRWHVFSTGAFIGAVWGGLYVVIPTLSSVFLTETVSILPIPFIDFTVPVKAVLPAAVIGIATDLVHVLFGLVLPFWVVIGVFSSSMLVNVFANPILYAKGILHTWEPGMSAIPTQIANTFDFWLSFSLGGAIVVAIIGFWTAGKVLIAAARGIRSEQPVNVAGPSPQRGDIKIISSLGIWAASTVCFVVMVYLLVPDFPWWITAATSRWCSTTARPSSRTALHRLTASPLHSPRSRSSSSSSSSRRRSRVSSLRPRVVPSASSSSLALVDAVSRRENLPRVDLHPPTPLSVLLARRRARPRRSRLISPFGPSRSVRRSHAFVDDERTRARRSVETVETRARRRRVENRRASTSSASTGETRRRGCRGA